MKAIRLQAPPKGWLKLNYDGASKRESSTGRGMKFECIVKFGKGVSETRSDK